MAETLDEVSGGRVILGLGAGWNEPEFRAFGFPFEQRFDRFEESLRIVCSLFRTGRADVEGQHVQARGALLKPRGPRPFGPEVMVGATGPRLLRLAAELADHWNAGARDHADARRLQADVDGACAAVGRDPKSLTRSVEAIVRVVPPGTGAETGDATVVGTAETIADAIRGYAALGFDHLHVQLRPNTVGGVRAFAPVIAILRGEAQGPT